MAAGFRKSFLGFNCEDVLNYIESSHKAHNEKEKELKGEISNLNGTVESLKKQLSDLTAERDEISAKLQEFNKKYEEIDRLSQNIGKLYLVAQSNAQAIMRNAAESSAMAQSEVENNVNVISDAHQSLTDIRNEINETSAAFTKKVGELINSLDETRKQITDNTADIEQRKEDFAAVVQLLER